MHKWLPWKFILRHLALSRGFLDPLSVYAQLQRFSQPAEVAEPEELLRAGIVFHARGLINSKVIQHNLDWVWPFWVEKQFDPRDTSFMPRAFSITHVNLTHRNWSAIGLPGLDTLPVVDPRGLLTPFWDAWSLDTWVILDDQTALLPSREPDCQQRLLTTDSVVVQTRTGKQGISLCNHAEVQHRAGKPVCRLSSEARSPSSGWLVVSVRPYNPEGVSFIDSISLSADRTRWLINGSDVVQFGRPAERSHLSSYTEADVFIHLLDKEDSREIECPVGMATAAAMYRIEAGRPTSLAIDIPLNLTDPGSSHRARKGRIEAISPHSAVAAWQGCLAEKSTLDIPDSRFVSLYESAIRTLVLCTPGDVYAGPYTYKRFWYRDAVFIAHGLLSAGLLGRVKQILSLLPAGQQRNGYFHSQQGEWDSNGQVLWLLERYCRLSGEKPDSAMQASIGAGADWIINKRLSEQPGQPYAGLLPAGFSAEHLGPNDYYYWDNFWGIAGLKSASFLSAIGGKPGYAHRYAAASDVFAESVQRSIESVQTRLRRRAIPASPMRRLDAGAIGSVACSYPLRLCAPDDELLQGTVEFLLQNCFVENGFFQDMIHSGINAYLTLHVAQALLRAGDARYIELINAVADLASPTGNWPEAVHPATGGGCMGDGHHAWAAAEWIAIMRNIFVREEGQTLIVGSGIPAAWLAQGTKLGFGPTATEFGRVSVVLQPVNASASRCRVSWSAEWHREAPVILVSVPGYCPVEAHEGTQSIELQREDLA